MKNTEISILFREMAQLLAIRQDNPFRIRAYERAADILEQLTEDILTLAQENRLGDVPGIGKDLAGKIQEYLATGRVHAYEDLKKSFPTGLLELLKIPGIGPKTVGVLYKKLHIKNIRDLKKAIETETLNTIPGCKEKTIENMRAGIRFLEKGKERMYLAQATEVADEILAYLKETTHTKAISVAGSLRRQKETVRDIDILAVAKKPKQLMTAFTHNNLVGTILSQGETKSSIRTKKNIQIDCRVVKESSFGSALLYFTGSKNFNIKLRSLAQRQNLKINEYGVFKNGKRICGKTETEIFRQLGLQFIPPELREDTGEIELAKHSQLPDLIQLEDIQGDLHVHSRWSDGTKSIADLASAAKKKGYSYIAIADHSQGLKIAGGLSIASLKRKKREIDSLNAHARAFRILYATEVDIDSSGNLDYPADVLRKFDIVIAAIHTGFKQSSSQLTKRIINACKNPFVHIIAHPTGRLWGTREGYTINVAEILRVARDTNTNLEINSFPQRLDINDTLARQAKEAGVRVAINTDAHTVSHLDAMHFGVSVARRGWLEKQHVINTAPVEELLRTIKKR